MTHAQHVSLIKGGVEGRVWAEMGSGTGAFTLALADILGPGGKIFSVDRDGGALGEQRCVMEARFPEVEVEYVEADFTQSLELPRLDGILAANSIHFVGERVELLRKFREYLEPGGRLLVVEYNADSGNTWVPYPFSYDTFAREASEVGYREVEKLKVVPSEFLGEIYSAVAENR